MLKLACLVALSSFSTGNEDCLVDYTLLQSEETAVQLELFVEASDWGFWEHMYGYVYDRDAKYEECFNEHPACESYVPLTVLQLKIVY